MTASFIASTIPAKTVRASDTTLFEIAMRETGDPLQWVSIALLNGLVDPWVVALKDILIPPMLPNGVQTGILEPSAIITLPPYTITAAPVVATPTTSGPLLDFSNADNSQYLPLI